LTTQYLEEADRLAQDIVVMEKGRVIAKGTPAELKAQLGTTVIEVSFASHELAERASLLVANLTPKAPIREGSLLELTVENGPKIAAEVLRTLDGAQVELLGLALREPSLDDVFLSLTGHRTEEEAANEAPAKRQGRKAKKESAQ
ncbi:MAG: DUF4162 domain-containing protein, partial [Actinomycetes bacterium]